MSGKKDDAACWGKNNCCKIFWCVLGIVIVVPVAFLIVVTLLSLIGKLGDVIFQFGYCNYSDFKNFQTCTIGGFFSLVGYANNIFTTALTFAPLIALMIWLRNLNHRYIIISRILIVIELIISVYFPFFLGLPLNYTFWKRDTCNLASYGGLMNMDCYFTGFLTALIIGGGYFVIFLIVLLIYCVMRCIENTKIELDNEQKSIIDEKTPLV